MYRVGEVAAARKVPRVRRVNRYVLAYTFALYLHLYYVANDVVDDVIANTLSLLMHFWNIKSCTKPQK